MRGYWINKIKIQKLTHSTGSGLDIRLSSVEAILSGAEGSKMQNDKLKFKKDLEKEIKNSKIPVLVEFWGSWCPPCQMMSPILDEIEKEFSGKIKILKINSDMNPEISSGCVVKGVPTFILFNNGREIKREFGAKSKKEIYNLINKSI